MGKDWLPVDRVTLAAFVVLVALSVYGYMVLPASIPTSFGFDGAPHAYNPKYFVFLEPVVAALFCILVAFAPTRMNLPFTVPPERMPLVAPISEAYQRLVRAELLCGLVAIEWFTIESSRANWLSPGFFVAVVTMGLVIVATVVALMVRVWRVVRG